MSQNSRTEVNSISNFGRNSLPLKYSYCSNKSRETSLGQGINDNIDKKLESLLPQYDSEIEMLSKQSRFIISNVRIIQSINLIGEYRA